MTIQTMTDDFATLTTPTELVIRRWLPGPVERIWDFLTRDDLRRQWLAAGEMELRADAPFELVWRNDGLSLPDDPRPDGFAEEERMASRVVAVEPMRSLTIAWGEGDVTFDLAPKGERVLLTLTHRGLHAPEQRTMVAAGWHTHLDILGAVITGAVAPSFWSSWIAVRRVYEHHIG